MNRAVLEQPFPKEAIKQRQGSHGEVLDYIEGHVVIQRLNEAFEGRWGFQVVHHDVKDEEVIVLGRFEADGIAKMQFGSSQLTRSRKDGNSLSLGDDLKAAATDSLKKCATLLGVGLHLYGDNSNGESSPSVTQREDEGSQPKPPTDAQLRAISAIARSRDIPEEEVRRTCSEAFGVEDPKFLSRQEASDFIHLLQSKGRTS